MATTANAATLFDGGRTVHYKLKVPIKIQANSRCNFQVNTATAELVRRASLFIIDEYTMGHKKISETIDRTFRDIMENDLPYGGKIFLHSGDWVSIYITILFSMKYFKNCFLTLVLFAETNITCGSTWIQSRYCASYFQSLIFMGACLSFSSN